MAKDLQHFEALLREKLPNLRVNLDAPDSHSGSWWVDVRMGKKHLALEYRPRKGFGVFHKDAGYGEGPSETYRTAALAARRVMQLLIGGKEKRGRLTLKDLRELYGCSQVNLAQKAGVKQSAISRFEHRAEVKLGTLAAAVKALGGELEIRARFSDADVSISVKKE